jgi:hypothetical protein
VVGPVDVVDGVVVGGAEVEGVVTHGPR